MWWPVLSTTSGLPLSGLLALKAWVRKWVKEQTQAQKVLTRVELYWSQPRACSAIQSSGAPAVSPGS